MNRTKEYKTKRIINGKLIWVVVDENENVINKNPDVEHLRNLISFKGDSGFYNDTKTCPKVSKGEICGRPLTRGNVKRERDKNWKTTGKWICNKCYSIDYNNLYIKPKRRCRTGHLNPDSTTSKGNKFQELACMHYGWKNLNIKNNNFNSPIDCIDPRTGLFYQIKGRVYNHIERYWQFSPLDREWDKKYEDMICYCTNKDLKIIERIYRIPSYEIDRIRTLTITKNPSRGVPWYEKYRADEEELKKANEIWKKLNV